MADARTTRRARLALMGWLVLQPRLMRPPAAPVRGKRHPLVLLIGSDGSTVDLTPRKRIHWRRLREQARARRAALMRRAASPRLPGRATARAALRDLLGSTRDHGALAMAFTMAALGPRPPVIEGIVQPSTQLRAMLAAATDGTAIVRGDRLYTVDDFLLASQTLHEQAAAAGVPPSPLRLTRAELERLKAHCEPHLRPDGRLHDEPPQWMGLRIELLD